MVGAGGFEPPVLLSTRSTRPSITRRLFFRDKTRRRTSGINGIWGYSLMIQTVGLQMWPRHLRAVLNCPQSRSGLWTVAIEQFVLKKWFDPAFSSHPHLPWPTGQNWLSAVSVNFPNHTMYSVQSRATRYALSRRSPDCAPVENFCGDSVAKLSTCSGCLDHYKFICKLRNVIADIQRSKHLVVNWRSIVIYFVWLSLRWVSFPAWRLTYLNRRKLFTPH